MARGRRPADFPAGVSRRRGSAAAAAPGPLPDREPFRLWLSGVLVCVPDPVTGVVRIAHDYNGTRSEAWAEEGMLPVPLPLSMDGRSVFWQSPPGWCRPSDALRLWEEQLAALVEREAREVWGS